MLNDFLDLAVYNLIINKTICEGAIIMDKVILKQEKVTIPTYEISDYDKNPMFLEKRVYQGSSGRVYPHPVCEGVSDIKTDKEYNAIFLENDYILVMILPEIGGKIQRLYDKTNGYDAVYYNEVVLSLTGRSITDRPHLILLTIKSKKTMTVRLRYG